jgi:hypothetical protein
MRDGGMLAAPVLASARLGSAGGSASSASSKRLRIASLDGIEVLPVETPPAMYRTGRVIVQ